jgi:hypothetical protein
MQTCIVTQLRPSLNRRGAARIRPQLSRVVPRATDRQDSATTPSAAPSEPPSPDDRIEKMEAMRKQRRAPPATPRASRPIPIRGMTTPQQADSSTWRTGQLLPDNWEQLTAAEKLNQLYMGDRGALFWLNKAAYVACFGLVGGWIVFRFVGPALGLYQLSNTSGLPSL